MTYVLGCDSIQVHEGAGIHTSTDYERNGIEYIGAGQLTENKRAACWLRRPASSSGSGVESTDGGEVGLGLESLVEREANPRCTPPATPRIVTVEHRRAIFGGAAAAEAAPSKPAADPIRARVWLGGLISKNTK